MEEEIEKRINQLVAKSRKIKCIMRKIILLLFLIVGSLAFCVHYGDCIVNEHPFLYLTLTFVFFVGCWGYASVQCDMTNLE